MQQPQLHPSTIDHRPHITNHHPISNYTHTTAHYSSVKVEDEHYMVGFVIHCVLTFSNITQATHQNQIHYPYNAHTHTTHHGLDWQGGYSTERGHLER